MLRVSCDGCDPPPDTAVARLAPWTARSARGHRRVIGRRLAVGGRNCGYGTQRKKTPSRQLRLAVGGRNCVDDTKQCAL